MNARRLILAAAAGFALVAGGPAAAHPLGQNAYNRDAAIRVEPQRLRLDYLLDLAEIPALAAGEEADTNHDGRIDEAEWNAYAAHWAAGLPAGLVVEADGRRLALTLRAQHWALAPGQSGLQTLRLLAQLEAPLPSAAPDGATAIAYRDETRADRLGWKDVSITAAPGVTLAGSDVPATDETQSMSRFDARAEGPPARLVAHATIRRAAATTAATPDDAPLLALDAKAGTTTPATSVQALSIAAFFKLGVHHIATGWDHLMFLLGLVLLSRSLRQLGVTVTAFTVAHSLTLGLAAFGLVQPPGEWVEALIAATIAYVGLVALAGRARGHGPWLAFGFGLIHGFGFAGALSESLGATNSLRLTGLLSFNLGIETFQLSLVAVVVPLLHALSRRTWYASLHRLLAAVVVCAGAGWLLLRTVGDGWLGMAGLALVVTGLLGFLVGTRRRHEAAVAA